jgi:hypothetical protein
MKASVPSQLRMPPPQKSESADVSTLHNLTAFDNFHDLLKKYVIKDQELINSRQWDYDDATLLTNQIKKILLATDPLTLGIEENECRREILWLWYHHAISCAIWTKKDRSAALSYAAEALRFQPENHPNQITRLLYLLVQDRMAAARKWASSLADGTERRTALELIADYQAGKFFG